MVGDATNDAPALRRADVGVALAGHGGGVTAEAADAVILNDDLSRVSEAIVISRRTMRIARQSIWIGLGLSGVAMAFVVLACASLTTSAWLLVVGFAGHGLKDGWQHRSGFVSGTRWWPPFCAAIDFVVAIAIGIAIVAGTDLYRS